MSVEQKAVKKYPVNLPQTEFPMQAKGAVREPEFQKLWDEQQVYKKNLDRLRGKETFILHDGPPYLSAVQIHVGTALNKILKDIVVKYKTLQGFFSPYVPGFDSHGLPIENAALKKLKTSRHSLTPLELRIKCKEFALENLAGMTANFKRLGVLGEWERPYLTLNPEYEAAQLRVFGAMAAKGYIYKGLKPVYWCPTCETALAEAEVEYADHKSPSIYVRFPVKTGLLHLLPQLADHKVPIHAVIWTTTPWTLPANVALSVSPDLEYAFVRHHDEEAGEDEILIVADELLGAFKAVLGRGKQTVIGKVKGKLLEGTQAQHPFIDDRNPVFVLGDHVKADVGTGIVHTAPGHGMDDYKMSVKYNLPILAPVDDRGVFTEAAGKFAGLKVQLANEAIIDELKNLLMLVNASTLVHQYPHCWRCKNPLLFRATEQWFTSVEGFRDAALQAIKGVQWVPPASEQRITSMVAERADWCISRQRWWGVPIPAFYCLEDKEVLLTAATVGAVADVFAKEGSDAWWKYEADHFLPAGTACPKCGGTKFRKETDIMDVWFDSGTSHTAVLTQHPDLHYPADMYLEGSDQHRGWFQSSLLTAVASTGQAPYRVVLTHGFVLDEKGHKMSKSLGNVVDPQQVIDKFGADVLRLWVASVDYTDDVRVSYQMIEKQLGEVYRKIRNTARYLIGNLFDFDPGRDRVPYSQLPEFDRYALHRLQEVVNAVAASFDRYAFYQFYQQLQNYAVVDLSNFYLDVVKDTLYTARADAPARRAVQTVLFEILHALVRLLVPVLPHLAEDIWQHLPSAQRVPAVPCAQLTDWPKIQPDWSNAALAGRWEQLRALRDRVNAGLEGARRDKLIGASLEARVDLQVGDGAQELHASLTSLGDWLPRFLIVSQVSLLPPAGQEQIAVSKAAGQKCERCWVYSEKVGSFTEHPTLCERCVAVVA